MRRLAYAGMFGYGLYLYSTYEKPPGLMYCPARIRTRKENIESMKSEEYDLLIIGGGATGAGLALEASTRGLKSCLIEKGDFSSQTSSKSTKLLHGGVRYLQKASQGEDIISNISLVFEGLRERSIIISSAKYMTSWIPLSIPCSGYFELLYFYSGMLVYHLMALVQSFSGPAIPRPWMSLDKNLIPNIKSSFVGNVVFYDGQMNDSRLCLEVLFTSACEKYTADSVPAHIANYVKFVDFITDNGKIVGAKAVDLETGQQFFIKCKVAVNCTGPFSDKIRHAAGLTEPRIVPGKGSHLILPRSYAPNSVGLLIPKTKDNRVIFLLPWQDHAILGTTDELGTVSEAPQITKNEKEFLIEELSNYISTPRSEIEKDVLGSFSGERPLVKSKESATSQLLRTHEVEIDEKSGLVSVLGGKWTTFRAMAEEAVDEIIENFGFKHAVPSVSREIIYISNHSEIGLREKLIDGYGLAGNTADHLMNNYGTKSEEVAQLGTKELVTGHPFIEGEVRFAASYEYAMHPTDVIARRLRFALVDYKNSVKVVDKVAGIMGRELGWSEDRINREIKRTVEELKQFFPN